MAGSLRKLSCKLALSSIPGIRSQAILNFNHIGNNLIKHQVLHEFSTSTHLLNLGKVKIHFEFTNGNRKTIEAKVGTNLLDVVLDHDVDIDGFGACEGTLACSTCHCVLPQDVYDKLPPPVDEELDMLDLAYDLTDTSRLGCQVVLTKDLDGLVVKVPEGIEDARG